MNLQENIARIKVIMEAGQVKPVHEVSDELYDALKNIHSNDRIIMSSNSEITFKQIPIEKQTVTTKPRGLWYGIGSSWVDWVRSEMPDWEVDNIFKIDINTDRMLLISTSEELLAFNKKYGAVLSEHYSAIDWAKVASDYGGIEISPYNYKLRMNREVFWYYGWDVASGCIWDEGIVTGVTKL
jgi:hypothetical protein